MSDGGFIVGLRECLFDTVRNNTITTTLSGRTCQEWKLKKVCASIIHTYIHIYIRTYIHTYIYIYISYIDTHTDMYNIHTSVYTSVNIIYACK